MKINIKATNFELTDAIRDYATKKIESLESKYLEGDESVMCDIEVGKISEHHKQGDVFRAEVNIHYAHGEAYASVEKDNLYAAIDEVKDEVAKTIRRKKDRRHTLIRKGGATIKKIIKGFRW
jgi:ribosomal subunit interface protein